MKSESWLPAAPASAPEARALVRAAASRLRLDGSTTWELMLATTEAVANAIEHGEPCDPRGIRLRIENVDGGLGVEVRDCGDSSSAPRSSKLSGEGGRGLPIIAALMDGVDVTPGPDATRVRFAKRLALV
jgi:serine/threonine-protein kinase RsbW